MMKDDERWWKMMKDDERCNVLWQELLKAWRVTSIVIVVSIGTNRQQVNDHGLTRQQNKRAKGCNYGYTHHIASFLFCCKTGVTISTSTTCWIWMDLGDPYISSKSQLQFFPTSNLGRMEASTFKRPIKWWDRLRTHLVSRMSRSIPVWQTVVKTKK